jgi:TonB-dependent SusC/RagA subfamily outer membrane receptor
MAAATATLQAKVKPMHQLRTTHAVRILIILTVTASAGCAPPKNRPATNILPNPHATSTSSDASLVVDQSRHVYTSMEELIEARAPGVQVIRQNGTFALRIRGLSSPVGNLDPLIVIDGHPSDLPGTRALEALSPNDVVRIEVLKDAASTAFYGSRGGSGVILVKTKKT